MCDFTADDLTWQNDRAVWTKMSVCLHCAVVAWLCSLLMEGSPNLLQLWPEPHQSALCSVFIRSLIYRETEIAQIYFSCQMKLNFPKVKKNYCGLTFQSFFIWCLLWLNNANCKLWFHLMRAVCRYRRLQFQEPSGRNPRTGTAFLLVYFDTAN